MKRTMSRRLRNHAEYAPVAGHADHYIGKHENLDGIMAELSAVVEEMTEKLVLTAEYMAEVVEKNAERIRKIAELIHIRVVPNAKVDMHLPHILPQKEPVVWPCYAWPKAVIPCVGMV